MLAVRPKIGQLTFHLFSRVLHPELFEPLEEQQIDARRYQARVQLNSTGHLVSVTYGRSAMTEITASPGTLLPKSRRVLMHRPKARRVHQSVNRPKMNYYVAMENVHLPAGEFWSVQEQTLSQGAAGGGLVWAFPREGRLATGAISSVQVDPSDSALIIRAVHTFPDTLTVLTTRSVFEWL